MKLTIMLACAALGGCGQARSDNQVEANSATTHAEAGAVSANGGETADSVTAVNSGERPAATTEVSSAMPVPGTNTPEHVVVNDDGASLAANRN